MEGAAVSVVNQVLNRLEQRGAHTTTEQAMVRAVPHTKRSISLPILAFALVFVAGIAAWQLLQTRKPNAAAENVAPKATQEASHAGIVGGSPNSYEHEKPTLPYRPVEIIEPASGVVAANLPASHLSFELSSVPLPSAIRPSEESTVVPAQPANEIDKPQPIKTVTANTKVAVQTPNGALPMKQVSSSQQADAEFRKATALMQQGRIDDALAGYKAALRLDAGHDAARQALVALLLKGKRSADAERLLQDRLNSKPDHIGFTMMLARLQVERGAVAEATATLGKALPYADSQADYHAFLAALLQRQDRNDEAIAHYQIALQSVPDNGNWLMGYGISLQAAKRNVEAKAAFKHALDTQTLSPDLQAFIRQKIKEL
jgi:MSHA biogenesis protein MshN